MSQSDSSGSTRLGVKEAPIGWCVEVDKHFCLILRNHINLGNNVFYNLLDYGIKYIKNITTKE